MTASDDDHVEDFGGGRSAAHISIITIAGPLNETRAFVIQKTTRFASTNFTWRYRFQGKSYEFDLDYS